LIAQERIEFLKGDMANLFTPAGLDKTAFEERIVFRDPISTYSSLSSASQSITFTPSRMISLSCTPTPPGCGFTCLHLSRYI
jgi:hypothetical protein